MMKLQRASVKKIENSGRSHAVAMEQQEDG